MLVQTQIVIQQDRYIIFHVHIEHIIQSRNLQIIRICIVAIIQCVIQLQQFFLVRKEHPAPLLFVKNYICLFIHGIFIRILYEMEIDMANGISEQNVYIEKANVSLKYSKTIVFKETLAVNWICHL